MKYILLTLSILTLSACSDSYRYPCQDPDNWDDKYCKKPFCSANGTCPEDLTHYEKNKVNGQVPSVSQPMPSVPSKGECK